MPVRQSAVCLFVGAMLVIPCPRCVASTIYVDNRFGNDSFDGASSEQVDVRSGPLKTIRRALEMARQGDTVVIANRGVPYYESISLSGRRHCGYREAKFTIVGNGAVVSGARLVPAAAWKEVAPDLWRFSPWRKGHYQLILNGQPLPETPVARGAQTLPKIPAGQWAAWRGSIYYQAARFVAPSEQPFAFAADSVGLTLSEVHDVQIVGLSFRHFRLDGISAHSLCRNVVLEQVQSLGNGRAGLFVGGTSAVEAIECNFTNNRRHNILIRGRHAVARVVPELTAPPTFID